MRTSRDFWFFVFSSSFLIVLSGFVSGLILASLQMWEPWKQSGIWIGFIILIIFMIYAYKRVEGMDKEHERKETDKHDEIIDELRNIRRSIGGR